MAWNLRLRLGDWSSCCYPDFRRNENPSTSENVYLILYVLLISEKTHWRNCIRISDENDDKRTSNQTAGMTGLVECPLVFTPDLLLFLGREIVLDVERLSDLLWCLALDHLCHCLACKIKKPLNIQVICSLRQNQVFDIDLTCGRCNLDLSLKNQRKTNPPG